jgi:hypothetical protein
MIDHMTPPITDTDNIPTFAVHDGALHVQASGWDIEFQWSPEPLARERSTNTQVWQACWPEFRLIRPIAAAHDHELTSLDMQAPTNQATVALQKATAFTDFRTMVGEKVAVLAERFRSHQWPLLVLLHEQPLAHDLAANNPVLAYCLAHNSDFRDTAPDVAARLAILHAVHKQRAILDWLGFPATEAMVRLLRKIGPEAASPMELRILRNRLKDDPSVIKLLAHVPCINAGVLGLIINPSLTPLITPKLLLEVAHNDQDFDLGHTPDRLFGSLALLRNVAQPLPTRPFTSLAQIDHFETECDNVYRAELERRDTELADWRKQNKRTAKRTTVSRVRPFPPPPISGIPGIVPLTTAGDVRTEGVAQTNCVGRYVSLVRGGQYYIYRVETPQDRATLAIVRGPDGDWRRADLKGPHNQKVHKSTVVFVESWLAQYRLSV